MVRQLGNISRTNASLKSLAVGTVSASEQDDEDDDQQDQAA
jgi:hypothetical protein